MMPIEFRPFNNDDPNDGTLKRFVCRCHPLHCIEVTPTWRSIFNNAWWIESYCSEECANLYSDGGTIAK